MTEKETVTPSVASEPQTDLNNNQSDPAAAKAAADITKTKETEDLNKLASDLNKKLTIEPSKHGAAKETSETPQTNTDTSEKTELNDYEKSSEHDPQETNEMMQQMTSSNSTNDPG